MARRQAPREQASPNGSAERSGDVWDAARGGGYFDGLKIGSRSPIQVQTGKKVGSFDRDGQVSPGSLDATNFQRPSSPSPNISPSTTSHSMSIFGNHRRELGVALDGSGSTSMSSAPRLSVSPHAPPTGWSSSNGSTVTASSAFPVTYRNDSSDSTVQLSPSFRPGSGRSGLSDSPEGPFFGDERRPSVASVTTSASSTGSKSSVGRSFHKKLHGFFGEEFPMRDYGHNSSETSLPVHGSTGKEHMPRSNHRNNSTPGFTANSAVPRPSTPGGSRPRTPVPSSDVVPFLYQDYSDIPQFGDAPVRQTLAGPDKQRYASADGAHDADHNQPPPTSSSGQSNHLHGLHFPHRRSRSKEDSKQAKDTTKDKDSVNRPPNSREDSSSSSLRRFKEQLPAMGSTTRLVPRPSSPSPNSHTGLSRDSTPRSPPIGHGSNKKSFFDKFKKTNRHKDEHDPPPPLKGLISRQPADIFHKSGGSTPGRFGLLVAKVDAPLSSAKRNRDGSVSTIDIPSMPVEQQPPRKEAGGKASLSVGKVKAITRGQKLDCGPGKVPDNNKDDSAPGIFDLDTDLTRMDGIITSPAPITPLDTGVGGMFTSYKQGEDQVTSLEDISSANGTAMWNAPDSWAVKKIEDDNMERLGEIDECGAKSSTESDGVPFCVRVFRVDSTFATLSTHLNTSVSETLQLLGRKSFLQDNLENYQIVLRKHDLQRILGPSERPLQIQKRFLEQAGYTSKDRIDEVGREDNSYLCRFTFVPAKVSGYSLGTDPGFSRMHKFSHVDLQGRNLITIPITLYQKATEIISLNLSRNLSLDVPKDFIQSCINLREIKFMSNEAWRLPPSLSLANRLTYLDISNNRLEQLDHANLSNLLSLVSVKVANNRLSRLPSYFGQFKALRNLNVSSNYLETFPEFLCGLKNLVDLDISFNSIRSLPEEFGRLIALERLVATNNKLAGSLPGGFGDLKALKELDIRFNGISCIDPVFRLPRLEVLMVGHNGVSVVEGPFSRIKMLHLSHNPLTRFAILNQNSLPTLTTLSLASGKLSELPDGLFEKLPNLEKLILDKNHFATLSPQIGKLRKLEHLSIAKNPLSSLPIEIGLLTELRLLDLRENNLKKIPAEIWHANKLETLNISSNVLAAFPKPGNAPPASGDPINATNGAGSSTPQLSSKTSYEELGRLDAFASRRPSHASSSGLLSAASSPASSHRKGSVASIHTPTGRKASFMSRNLSDGTVTPVSGARKDSNSSSNRITSTFAGSLKHLYLADNRLNDDVFDEISMLPELRILNLSYNELYDIPPRTISRWPHLTELYLSGNELTSLPSDDLEAVGCLKILHINGNKFQVLPAELGKVKKLTVLDCGSNSLKYNVSNLPYDWNWNLNAKLKYLNLSGNKRLEIKPNPAAGAGRDVKDLTNFNALHNLRVLGLMDVTLTVPSVPDQTEDRRVRTSGSTAGKLAYGMADTLGRNEHLSTIDMVIPKFRSHDYETLIGMFDGQEMSSGGSKVAKFLHENFTFYFTDELSRLRKDETPIDALRRTFLTLNKELATAANQSLDEKAAPPLAHRGSVATAVLGPEDLNSGGVATVLFLQNMELYVANVGDLQAMLIHSEGGHRIISKKHDPADNSERQRIQEAGGYVSRHGKLNDALDVSRAFGYIKMMPAVMAAPHISHITLKEQDEMVLIGSRELWEYLSPDVVMDVARSERGDLMRAAQKLRDLAIAFGATGKLMVMMIGVSDLKRKERYRYRAQSISMGPSGYIDENLFPSRNRKRLPRDAPDDSTLARLDQEVEAPTGDLSLVFTDIKNSTQLWESYPIAMRSAIRLHNAIMRRQLRIIGGYEVKTEGDAFMVCFPTVTSALLWCFSVQSQLLEAAWPSEVLQSIHGEEVQDSDGNVIFRGLSVRMGAHWGAPVCEPDPITGRMDYFGPIVNRASRISSVADGGQITVSVDFLAEIHRCLETYQESDRTGSVGSEDTFGDEALGYAIRRELRSLSSQGFEVKELGERKLKGLENPEPIFLMYPHSLAGRLAAQQQRADAQASSGAMGARKESTLTLDADCLWNIWKLSLRLEMICGSLEDPTLTELKVPNTGVMEKMKSNSEDMSDKDLIDFLEHHVARIETCITALGLRHLNRPFYPGMNLLDMACPMAEVFARVGARLAELARITADDDDIEEIS
ncbi:MAG: cysteinyl-tRNA synthetase [Geoglossum umbratile]|nr:MAG: cysteinyl-tRNA synthetase [Geoglossum umbratile]